MPSPTSTLLRPAQRASSPSTTLFRSGSVADSGSVTSHSLGLSGLTSSTTYHFQVTSVDGSGQSASSTDATFTTAAPPVNLMTNAGFESRKRTRLNASHASIAYALSYVHAPAPRAARLLSLHDALPLWLGRRQRLGHEPLTRVVGPHQQHDLSLSGHERRRFGATRQQHGHHVHHRGATRQPDDQCRL